MITPLRFGSITVDTVAREIKVQPDQEHQLTILHPNNSEINVSYYNKEGLIAAETGFLKLPRNVSTIQTLMTSLIAFLEGIQIPEALREIWVATLRILQSVKTERNPVQLISKQDGDIVTIAFTPKVSTSRDAGASAT